jgi:hypothetical protein
MPLGVMIRVVHRQTLGDGGMVQTVIGREKGKGGDSRAILPILDDDFR